MRLRELSSKLLLAVSRSRLSILNVLANESPLTKWLKHNSRSFTYKYEGLKNIFQPDFVGEVELVFNANLDRSSLVTMRHTLIPHKEI